jgi:hypothetical protein
VISTDARDPLFLEERIGHIDDVDLAEVDSDETPAEVDGGGRTLRQRFQQGSPDLEMAAAPPSTPPSRTASGSSEMGVSRKRRPGHLPCGGDGGGGGQRGPGERRSVRQLMVAG